MNAKYGDFSWLQCPNCKNGGLARLQETPWLVCDACDARYEQSSGIVRFLGGSGSHAWEKTLAEHRGVEGLQDDYRKSMPPGFADGMIASAKNLLARAEIAEAPIALDICSGLGCLFRNLQRRRTGLPNGLTLGVDHDYLALKHCVQWIERDASISSMRWLLLHCDAVHLPIASESIDLITSNSFFCRGRNSLLCEEAGRVLRPGGVLFLSRYLVEGRFADADPHCNLAQQESYYAEFGLTVEGIEVFYRGPGSYLDGIAAGDEFVLANMVVRK